MKIWLAPTLSVAWSRSGAALCGGFSGCPCLLHFLFRRVGRRRARLLRVRGGGDRQQRRAGEGARPCTRGALNSHVHAASPGEFLVLVLARDRPIDWGWPIGRKHSGRAAPAC
jgi:hypothetical protein